MSAVKVGALVALVAAGWLAPLRVLGRAPPTNPLARPCTLRAEPLGRYPREGGTRSCWRACLCHVILIDAKTGMIAERDGHVKMKLEHVWKTWLWHQQRAIVAGAAPV